MNLKIEKTIKINPLC